MIINFLKYLGGTGGWTSREAELLYDAGKETVVKALLAMDATIALLALRLSF
jgi:hypothetical protein